MTTMIQKSIITPFAFNFSYNFHHVAYIDLYRFLTCLDKLYTGVVSLSLFSFLRGNIPHFLPGRTDQIEPEDRKEVGRRCAEPRNGVCMMNASHLFKDVSQDSAEWRKDAAPGWLMRPSHPPGPVFGLLFLDLPQTSARSAEREAAGGDPSLREQIGG